MNTTETVPAIAEPTYTFRGHVLAGYHAHSLPPRFAASVETDNRDGGHAGTFVNVRPVPRFTSAHRAAAVAMVRNALGDDDHRVAGYGYSHLRRAVATALSIVSDPSRVAARVAVGDIPSDGTVPAQSSGPDPWTARQHETTVKRTRKGRTTVERKRVGIAPVRGDVDAMAWNGHADGMTDPRAILARSLATAELRADHVTAPNGATVYGARRIRSGARVALDVQRVTDRHYSHGLGVPALIGTDVTSWEQIVTVPNGVDPSRCRVAVGRSYIDDTASTVGAADLAGDRPEYGSHTRKAVTRPTRITLKRGRRRANDPREVTFYRPSSAVAGGLLTSYGYWQRVTLCTAPADDVDHRWRGHVLVARPTVRTKVEPTTTAARAERAERAAAKRAARDIGTVEVPETVHGVAELLTNVNRGESVKLRGATVRTVTRSGAGLYATQYTRPNGKRGTYRTRSAAAMAAFIIGLEPTDIDRDTYGADAVRGVHD